MKKGRFLWSAHRITEKQKAGKARNIKEKQLKNSRSTVSKQLVVLRSSASDNRLGRENAYKTSETLCFWGFFLPSNLYGMSRNVVECCVLSSWRLQCGDHLIPICSMIAM